MEKYTFCVFCVAFLNPQTGGLRLLATLLSLGKEVGDRMDRAVHVGYCHGASDPRVNLPVWLMLAP